MCVASGFDVCSVVFDLFLFFVKKEKKERKKEKINPATKQRCKYTTSTDIKNALEEVSHPAITCGRSAVILLDSRE